MLCLYSVSQRTVKSRDFCSDRSPPQPTTIFVFVFKLLSSLFSLSLSLKLGNNGGHSDAHGSAERESCPNERVSPEEPNDHGQRRLDPWLLRPPPLRPRDRHEAYPGGSPSLLFVSWQNYKIWVFEFVLDLVGFVSCLC